MDPSPSGRLYVVVNADRHGVRAQRVDVGLGGSSRGHGEGELKPKGDTEVYPASLESLMFFAMERPIHAVESFRSPSYKILGAPMFSQRRRGTAQRVYHCTGIMLPSFFELILKELLGALQNF